MKITKRHMINTKSDNYVYKRNKLPINSESITEYTRSLLILTKHNHTPTGNNRMNNIQKEQKLTIAGNSTLR